MESALWILLVTQAFNSVNQPTTTTVIPVFQSEQACIEAGNRIVTHNRTIYSTKFVKERTEFLCLPTK